MSTFSLIVAMDERRGIGRGGTLPWHLSADLKYFAKKTKTPSNPGQQNTVIMGRKTWESLPERFRPLPDRLNVVLTRNESYELPEGVERAQSLDEALKIEETAALIFVIGGGAVYQQAVQHPACKTLFITEVKGDFDCDTFFPEFKNDFIQIDASEWQTESDMKFRFLTYKNSGMLQSL